MSATEYDAARFCGRCRNQSAKVHIRLLPSVVEVGCLECDAEYELPRYASGATKTSA
jgi:hypothetical protein